MTLFFGSRERYEEYFRQNPGTYFLTTGWIERGRRRETAPALDTACQRHGSDLQRARGEYGEDNAQFLYDQLCDQTKHYRSYVHRNGAGAGRELPGDRAESRGEKGLEFSTEKGNLRLIHALVNGPWDDSEFLTVQPGTGSSPTSARVDTRGEGGCREGDAAGGST